MEQYSSLLSETDIQRIADRSGLHLSPRCIRDISVVIASYGQIGQQIDDCRNAPLTEKRKQLQDLLNELDHVCKTIDGMNPFISPGSTMACIEWRRATYNLVKVISNKLEFISKKPRAPGRKKLHARIMLIRALINTCEEETGRDYVEDVPTAWGKERSIFNKELSDFIIEIMESIPPPKSEDGIRKEIARALKNEYDPLSPHRSE